jgi:hypothetical protein
MMTQNMGRKEFLVALTALMGTTCSRIQPNGTSTSAELASLRTTGRRVAPQGTSMPFSDRRLDDVARTFAVTLAFLGDQLG